MTHYLITFLLFFLPFIVFPFISAAFEPPKVIIAEIIIEIMLIRAMLKDSITLKNYALTPVYVLTVLLVLSIIHVAFLSTSTTFFGNPFRMQGVFLLWHVLVFSFLSSTVSLKHVSYKVYAASLILLSIGVLLFGKNPAGRFIGTLGESNALSATVLFLWPFLFFARVPQFAQRITRIFSVVLPVCVLVLSGSRSGCIAFAIQIISLILIQKVRVPLKKVFVIFLFFIVLSLFLPFIEGGGRYEDRSDIWKTAVLTGFKNPIIGAGFGNIEHIVKYTSQLAGTKAQYQYVDSAHNILLDWWIQGGVAGLAVFLFLIGNTMYTYIKNTQTKGFILFIGLFTVLLFNPASVGTMLAFWWLIGQSFIKKIS